MSRLVDIIDPEGEHSSETFDLPLTIGTGEAAHIRLDGAGGDLAFIGESRGHLFLHPAAGGDVNLLHNDQALTGSAWLKSGDTIRWGEFVIRWGISGQRIEAHISRTTSTFLNPPNEPPPVAQKTQKREAMHPVLEPPRRGGGRFRPVLIGIFLLLLIGAAFVLLAKPLSVDITPDPDRISISGFPPVIRLGGGYLGLPGDYLLRAEKSGYQLLQKPIRIAAGNSSYSFSFEELPGLVEVISAPAGARLLVDGVYVGETPLPEVEVPVGRSLLRFEHPRYRTLEGEVEVTSGGSRQTLKVEMEPAWALIQVSSDPIGATLLVDGEEQGATPLSLDLLEGERRLLFQKEGYTDLDTVISVSAGLSQSPAPFKLIPAPALIQLTSTPVGATVSADGVFQGQAPLSIELPAGVKNKIRVTAVGYQAKTVELQLKAGDQQEVDIKLEPEYGTVFIVTTPPEATLLIDGIQQKQANGRFRLTTREHRLEFRADGYEPLAGTLVPRAGHSQRMEFSLKRKGGSQKNQGTAISKRVETPLGQGLILVQPRPFVMGASRQEPGRRANEREHPVKLNRSFYMSEREVSNADFRRFKPGHSSGMVGNRSLEIDSHPVVNVTWDDAARFLNWLSLQEGLTPYYREENGNMVIDDPTGLGYRLPSEAEWAFVARIAGREKPVRYPFEGTYPPHGVVGNFADESVRYLMPSVIKGYNDGYAVTAPVGSFTANPAGVYDLGGNVAEWCHDYYAASLATAMGTEVDPLGPASGTHHVVRGSSWSDASITELRLSYRRYSREAARDIGFRIARYAR